jgi:hypothetical protein
MTLGKYARYGVITLCGLLLFFLGASLPFQPNLIALASLFAIILLTVAMSYGNRTPLGGLFLGVFTSSSFLLGFFLMTCVWELIFFHPYMVGPIGKEYGLFLLTDLLYSYGPGMLSAVFAFISIGLFFGLLGYVFGHISLHVSMTQPRVFRDYWSSIHLLGKSDRREHSRFDRKLSSWSLRKRVWWKRLVEKITEPQPDLVFVPHGTRRSSPKFSRGDLFDLSSGRMISEDIIDPSDLTSKYRPLVLKVAETSSNPKGLRRLALERLLGRFLGWFIPSRVIWIFYLVLSALLVSSVYFVWTSNPAAYTYSVGVEYPVVVSAAIASATTLFFVWRWRKTSKELLERRPDERVLIFVVYIILALLYGFYFEVIVNPPAVPEGWTESWLIWTRWLLPLSLLLGLGYICVHRECEVANTYFYDNSSPTSGVSRVPPFKESHDEPFWLKEEKTKTYWVLRFMYFWRYEVAKVPHSDWERVEVWVDAEKGIPKWVVSDYHYRELWYRVEGDLLNLYVNFFLNFHTPIPVVDSAEADSISRLSNQKNADLIKTAITGKAPEIVEHLRDRFEPLPKRWTSLHPADWISGYGLQNVAAEFCSQLPWTCWRYPRGLEEPERYREAPAARPEDQPIPSGE